MYKCEICDKVSKKNATLFKNYKYRKKKYQEKDLLEKLIGLNITSEGGYEIESKKDICKECFQKQ